MTQAETSGVICVSQKSILLDGALLVENHWCLQNVRKTNWSIYWIIPFFEQIKLHKSKLLLNMSNYFVIAIQHKYANWKAFLVKRLTGAKTLPADFATKVRHYKTVF